MDAGGPGCCAFPGAWGFHPNGGGCCSVVPGLAQCGAVEDLLELEALQGRVRLKNTGFT